MKTLLGLVPASGCLNDADTDHSVTIFLGRVLCILIEKSSPSAKKALWSYYGVDAFKSEPIVER